MLEIRRRPGRAACRVLLAFSLLDRAPFLIGARHKLGLDRKLLSGEAHRVARSRLVDAFDLVKNPARLDYGHPVLRRAFAFAHTSFRGLLGYRFIGKHANPDLAAALDMTRHGDTSSFDLAIRDPRWLKALEPVLTEADLAATSRDAGHASAHLLPVLNFLRHQHSVSLISDCRLPIANCQLKDFP